MSRTSFKLREPLTWLTRHHKHLLPPPVYYDELCESSGYYLSPALGHLLLSDREVDASRGAIVIGAGGGDLPTTLAHEYRHHLQWNLHCRDWTTHDHRTCPFERDAFWYETSMAGWDAVTSRWRGMVEWPATSRHAATSYYCMRRGEMSLREVRGPEELADGHTRGLWTAR